MAADASTRNKITIGLADVGAGNEIGNVVRHTTGTASSLTVGPQSLQLGVSAGSVGFFGVTPASQASAAAVTDFASLKVALQAYGLVGT